MIIFEALSGNPIARIETVELVKAVQFSADGEYVISAAVENDGSEDLTMVVRRRS